MNTDKAEHYTRPSAGILPASNEIRREPTPPTGTPKSQTVIRLPVKPAKNTL